MKGNRHNLHGSSLFSILITTYLGRIGYFLDGNFANEIGILL